MYWLPIMEVGGLFLVVETFPFWKWSAGLHV
jgi:hypothetical protein